MIKLRANERIILTKRKHWFVLLRSVVGPLFLLTLPFVLYGFVAGTELSIGPTATIMVELSPALFTFIGAAWTLLIVMRLASIWTDSEQQKLAERSKEKQEKLLAQELTTALEPIETFYEAEEYHQRYLDKLKGT